MEPQKTLNSHRNIDNEKQNCRYHNPRFQVIPKSSRNQSVWYWHKNRHKDQQTRIENPGINL